MKTVAGVFKAFDKMKADLEKIGDRMKVVISGNTTKIDDLMMDNMVMGVELEAANKGIERINKFME